MPSVSGRSLRIMSNQSFLLTNTISPKEIKELALGELSSLAEEIRQEILLTVPKTGGHLASNLGVVELTLALHHVFNTPQDAIIWDVGHQCYPHKMITQRKGSFDQLRQSGGLSGFPKRSESVYDSADTGHSSTSISLALGMLAQRRSQGNSDKVIAVIGDGALTGGMAFEALNHGGDLGKDLIVIYNDNQMSISPNVGGFAKDSSGKISRWVSRLSATKGYRKLRDGGHRILLKTSWFGKFLSWVGHKIKRAIKVVIFKETLFTELGYEYVGPIDGHSLPQLIHTLAQVKEFRKPVVVHVMTKKGKGFEPAEKAPHRYHGVSPEVVQPPQSISSPTFTECFSRILIQAAEHRDNLFAITAAMAEGTGLRDFAKAYEDRFFDVGIAEQHAVTFGAGLALQGGKPVIAIYSSFLQRAVDQVIHDVAIQNLPVVIALDRAGFVGEDGETHQGLFDITLLRSVPNLKLLAPADCFEMEGAFQFAFEHNGPVVIRYPKGTCPKNLFEERGGVVKDLVLNPSGFGGRYLRYHGNAQSLVIAVGGVAQEAATAEKKLLNQGISCDVFSLFSIKPLDTEGLKNLVSQYTHVLILEEGMQTGGVGEAIMKLATGLSVTPLPCVELRAVDNQFVPQGRRGEQLAWFGMDSESIKNSVISKSCTLK